MFGDLGTLLSLVQQRNALAADLAADLRELAGDAGLPVLGAVVGRVIEELMRLPQSRQRSNRVGPIKRSELATATASSDRVGLRLEYCTL